MPESGRDRATLVALSAMGAELSATALETDDAVALVLLRTGELLSATVTLWLAAPDSMWLTAWAPARPDVGTNVTLRVAAGGAGVALVARLGVAQVVGAPLAARRLLIPVAGSGRPTSEVYGVLDVVAGSGREPFDAGDLAAATAVAERLSSSITTSRLLAQLTFRADHDPLTGLPNRAFLVRHLDEVLAGGADDGSTAVVFVDVDRFKDVNDALGHAVGDEVLQAVANRLRDSVRAGDVVSRFGGDEFVVVAHGFAEPEELDQLVTRLSAVPLEPLLLGEERVYVSLSAGVARHRPGDDADTMLRHADAAMFHAKATGAQRWEEFSEPMLRTSRERLRGDTELHEAIVGDQLFCEYQPILEARDLTVTMHEALVRWHHPRLGRLEPGAFIRGSEVSGLVVPLGVRVLEHALTAVASWPQRVAVAVNVSARQLSDPRFPLVVLEELESHDVDPGRLVIEITETAVMTDAETATRCLALLQSEGVRVSIDDFGTGYTSVDLVRRHPVDLLKIDQRFIASSDEPRGHDLLGALLELGRALGVPTVAEGVETTEQLIRVRALGTTFVQGYLFCRPVVSELVRHRVAGVSPLHAA
jgi:diguanylate cyclase (GGDEF)-like protein